MKKLLVFIISLVLPVLSYSQNQEQQTGIVLENNGIIRIPSTNPVFHASR